MQGAINTREKEGKQYNKGAVNIRDTITPKKKKPKIHKPIMRPTYTQESYRAHTPTSLPKHLKPSVAAPSPNTPTCHCSTPLDSRNRCRKKPATGQQRKIPKNLQQPHDSTKTEQAKTLKTHSTTITILQQKPNNHNNKRPPNCQHSYTRLGTLPRHHWGFQHHSKNRQNQMCTGAPYSTPISKPTLSPSPQWHLLQNLNR